MLCTEKVQSLIVLLLQHTCTNIQASSPSLQPWEWRMLRFKVISSIQQPGALHCQCITSFCSHMHSNAPTNTCAHNTLLVGAHSTHRISLTLTSETAKCLSGENMTLRRSTHIHKQLQVWISMETQLSVFFLCHRLSKHKRIKTMTIGQLLFSVII